MTKQETFLPQESRHTAQRGQRAACFTSIRDRLAVIVLVAMAPALLFFGLVSVDAYWNALGEANERLANYIEMSVLVQERRVQAAREIATILANTPDIQYRHENFCNIFAQIRQQHSEYANLGLTDAAGNVICSARPIDQPVNCADRPWFREAKATQRLSVDTYHLGHIAKSPVLVIGAPVSPDPGAQAGYVFVSLDADMGASLGKPVGLPSGTVLAIDGTESGLLLRNLSDEHWIARKSGSIPGMSGHVVKERGKSVSIPEVGGKPLIFYFSPASDSLVGRDVRLGIGIPSDALYGKVTRRHVVRGVTLALSVILAMVALWVGANRLILRRVRHLARAAQDLGQGDLNVRTGYRANDDELGDLGLAFDRMAEAVQDHQKQLENYKRALDEHAIVSVTDIHGIIQYVNDKFCEIAGYRREELIGQTHRIVNSGFHPQVFFDEMWHAISSGEVWQGNICNQRKDGRFYWVASTIVPFLDDSGLPVQYIAVRKEITEVLRLSDALQESERRFRLLAENGRDMVCLHAFDGQFLYVSPASHEVLGYTPEEVLGEEDPYCLIHPDDISRVQRDIHDPVLKGGVVTPEPFRMRHKLGGYVWLEAVVSPVFKAGQVAGFQSALRDVSARKAAADVLRLYERVAAASHSAITIMTAEAGRLHIIYVNPAFEAVYGMRAAETAGQDWLALHEKISDADCVASMRLAVSESSSCRAVLKCWNQFGHLFWIDVFLTPLLDELGALTHFIAVATDITGRIQGEENLIRAREAAEAASHAKSEFLARMSHELRTPLNAILGFSQLLEANPAEPLSENQRGSVERITKAGWHMLELINEVLDLNRVESGGIEMSLELLSPCELMKECIDYMLPGAQEKSLTIESQCMVAGPRRVVRADRLRLKQILINLLSNAVKFNGAGGRVRLTCESRDTLIRISVSDNGPGISAELQGQLFQPFSRLDADRKEIPGTGIGLAVSKRFAELMNGSVGFDSMPGSGSTFWVEVPAPQDMDMEISHSVS